MAPPTERRPVVAGVDAVVPNPSALVWAADEAYLRGAPLHLVHVLVPVPSGRHHPNAKAHRQSLREAGERALAEAVALVRWRHPGLEVSSRVEDGFPALVMCREGRRALTVVLGSRGLSRADEMLSAGSVGIPVSAQAACPVVVVREPDREVRPSPLVVVGVDGSRRSETALEYAFRAAELRNAVLRAVWVWRPPRFVPVDEEGATREYHRLLAKALAGPGAAFPGVEVEQEVVRGHPVEKLLEASAQAMLVVVGRRGHGGFTGMRMGSVAHGLLRHSPCPVAVVPLDEGDAVEGG